jgi:hypothetical protein
MDNEVYLLFDSGKTNTRLVLFDCNGLILDFLSITTPYGNLGDYTHLDSSFIRLWIINSLEYFSEKFKEYHISSFVPVTRGASAAIISSENLLLPIMDYESNSFEELNDEYDHLVRGLNKINSPKLPLGLNLGRQLYWQSKKYKDIWPMVTDILTYPQYISWLLTGHKFSEISSLSCHTDLWDPFKKTFSKLAISQEFNKIFPKLNHAHLICGLISDNFFQKKCLNNSCQVYVGGHDSSVAFYGYLRLLRERKIAIVSSGTWIVIMTSHFDINKINLSKSNNLVSNGVDEDLIYSSRFMSKNKASDFEIIDSFHAEIDSNEFLFIFKNKILFNKNYKNNLALIINFIACQSIHMSLLTIESLLGIDYSGDIVVEGSYVKDVNYLKALSFLWEKGDVFVNENQESNMSNGALNLIRKNKNINFDAATVPIKKIDKMNFLYPYEYVNFWREIN